MVDRVLRTRCHRSRLRRTNCQRVEDNAFHLECVHCLANIVEYYIIRYVRRADARHQNEADFSAFEQEAAWVSEQADIDPRIQAMVAWAPLEKGSVVSADLERLKRHSLLRGVRRIVQFEPDPLVPISGATKKNRRSSPWTAMLG